MPIKINVLPKNWINVNFSWKKRYANKVAAMGCIKRLKDDKDADKNAKE